MVTNVSDVRLLRTVGYLLGSMPVKTERLDFVLYANSPATASMKRRPTLELIPATRTVADMPYTHGALGFELRK